jgi:hypothetical protein
MDYFKDYERRIEKNMTIRETQERNLIAGKSHEHMTPYRSTMPKGFGEFSASDEDKLKVRKNYKKTYSPYFK